MSMASVSTLFQRLNFGLLCLRLTVGGFLCYQGLTKFLAGSETLRGVGSAIEVVGIPAPEGSITAMVFGVAAAGAELLGGLLIVVGFLYRLAIAPLLFVMGVATTLMYQNSGGELSALALPLLLGLVLFAMLWTGPGRFAVSKD